MNMILHGQTRPIGSKYSADLQDLISSMLERDPEVRFLSVVTALPRGSTAAQPPSYRPRRGDRRWTPSWPSHFCGKPWSGARKSWTSYACGGGCTP